MRMYSAEYWEAAGLFTKEELYSILKSLPKKDLDFIISKLLKDVDSKAWNIRRKRVYEHSKNVRHSYKRAA